MILHTFNIRDREVNLEIGLWFLFGVSFDSPTLAFMFGPLELNFYPVQAKAEWDWLYRRFHIWRRYWLVLNTDSQLLFGVLPYADHLAFYFGLFELSIERGCHCCWPGSERYRDERKLKWKSQVVRGTFADRTFDVDFWQSEGDETIFDAAWEMVQLADQAKGSPVADKPPFRELLRLLKKHRTRYLIVGDYGVMKHTEPIYTDQMDIWIEPTPKNAKRAHRALVEFGASMPELTVDELAQPHKVFRFGVVPARVDVATTIDAVAFPEAWKNRAESALDGIPVFVISLQDLIRNKAASNLDTDRLHLKRLRKYGRR